MPSHWIIVGSEDGEYFEVQEIKMSKYIDGEELIRWIKKSQQMTSKVRAIIAKILVMEEKEEQKQEHR